MTQDEDQQLRSLHNEFGVVRDWESLTGGPSRPHSPEGGSDLAADDISAHPYEVSNAAWVAVSAAVSHLGCLRNSLFVQTGPNDVTVRLDTFGQPTLVRGALENASRAVWLLESDDREERILRRLRLEWAEARQHDEVRREIGLPPTKSKDIRFAELSALAQAPNIDPRQIKKDAEYGQIVRAAGHHVASGSTRQFVIWKACSSLAHGDFRGTLDYLAIEKQSELSPGVALALATPNVLLLDAGARAAIETTKAALALFTKRSSAPAA